MQMKVMSEFLGGGCETSPCNEGTKFGGFADFVIKGMNGDVLPIDDLLNFSSEEIAAPILKGCSKVAENCSDTCCFAVNQSMNEILLLSEGLKSQPLSDAKEQVPGIGVPCEEIAELEWLSNFVEESFSLDQDYKFLANLGVKNLEKTVDQSSGITQFQTLSPVSVLETGSISADKSTAAATLSLPGRARSKRNRTGISSWSNGSSSMILVSTPAYSEFSTLCDAPCLSSKSAQSTEKPNAFVDNISVEDQPFPAKFFQYEAKKKSLHADQYPTIKCTHCGIQKTPQWRAGPLGPKTLCNACGVRYKSGRLLPEYRPAASPQYVPEKHSNSHKRVLEMRIQKELKLVHPVQQEQE